MEAHLRARDILFRNTIELWSIESIKKTVAANLGVSFLPTFAVEQEPGRREPGRAAGTHVRPPGPGHLRLA